MIEPLAHVAKGSVNRYTVLVTSTGNTRFPKGQFLRKDFFTPLPRPIWAEDTPSAVLPILETRERSKQCRLWSCHPSMHSIWCPSREELNYLDANSRLRGRTTHSRSNEPASDFLRHFLHHNTTSLLPSNGQRRHASAVPTRRPDDTSPSSASWQPQHPISPSGSAPPESEYVLHHKTIPDTPGYPPELLKFTEYAQDEMTVRRNPQGAYEACAAALDAGHSLETQDRLGFVQGMLRAVVNHWARDRDGIRSEWIEQVEELLELPSDSEGQTWTDTIWKDTLEAHVQALKGDIEQADALLRDVEWCSKHKRQTIEMMNTVMVSLCRTRPPEEVLEYLEEGIDELPAIHLSLSWSAPAMRALSDLIQDNSLTHLIPERTSSFHPTIFLVRELLLNRRDARKPIPQPWAKETIEAFLLKPEMVQAREIQGLYGTDDLAHRSFVDQNSGPTEERDRALQLKVVDELLLLYPGPDAFYYSSHLFLAAAYGDVVRAEECYDEFSLRATPTYREVESLLMAYANCDDMEGLTRTFDRLFPNSVEGVTSAHFRPAFYALFRSPVRQDDTMGYWRDMVHQANLVPNSTIYALIVQYYVKHDDVESLRQVFREIQEHGVQVNKFVYQSAMTYFARRGDVGVVVALFKRAKSDGVVPDLHFYANLMNAHVQAGTWPGLQRLHEYLKITAVQGGRPVVIQNILMKAAHLLGVPVGVLQVQFASLKDLGEGPDAHSYTTLAQAASDVGNMVAAEALFWEMVDRDAEEPGFLDSPHIFTILMNGYLYQRRVGKALFFCCKMSQRGIKPTTVTVGKMLMAVAQLPAGKASQMKPTLKEMLRKLRSSDKPQNGKLVSKGPSSGVAQNLLESIYYPMLHAALRQGEFEEVHNLYQQAVALGHKPSLAMKKVVLDSYHRLYDVDKVQEVWDDIFRQTCAAKRAAADIMPSTEGAWSYQLCAPFDIFLDAISRSGRHGQVQRAVDLYTKRKFQLDPSNHNTLILAYIRAGDPERAFGFYDRLVRGGSLALWPRLVQEREQGNASSHPSLPGMPPLRSAAARARRRKEIQQVLSHVSSKDVSGQGSDPVPIDVLRHKVAPFWRYWRVEGSVLSVLRRVVRALVNGYPIVPIPPQHSYHYDFSRGEVDTTAANRQLQSLKQFPGAWQSLLHVARERVAQNARNARSRRRPSSAPSKGERKGAKNGTGTNLGLEAERASAEDSQGDAPSAIAGGQAPSEGLNNRDIFPP